MNELQYQSLCEACDQVLLSPDSDTACVAIPWLHVIRPHPVFLDDYASVFGSETKTRWSYLRHWTSVTRNFVRALFSNGHAWVGEAPDRADVLIISHFVNESFAGQEDDFYYGDIATELEAQGKKTTFVLINHLGGKAVNLVSRWKDAHTPRLLLSPVLDFLSERVIYMRAYRECRRLRRLAMTEASSLGRRVHLRAAEEAVSSGAAGAQRLGEQIRRLVEELQPRAIVATYEGHAWERVVFAASRSANPKIKCIGYQHTALFDKQHAIQRQLPGEYNPDAIFTSGLLSKRELERNPALSGVRLSVMGSNRSRIRQPQKDQGGNDGACVVLPEGIESESKLLFEFSSACAKAMPETKFIWRLHPNLEFKTFLKRNPEFHCLPPNVVLSDKSLDDDIARSRWALYRGSTAIVQAVLSGLRPIYLNRPDEITIDPLYQIDELRDSVTTAVDFRALVDSEEPSIDLFDDLQSHCESMFTPLNANTLVEYIETECVEK